MFRTSVLVKVSSTVRSEFTERNWQARCGCCLLLADSNKLAYRASRDTEYESERERRQESNRRPSRANGRSRGGEGARESEGGGSRTRLPGEETQVRVVAGALGQLHNSPCAPSRSREPVVEWPESASEWQHLFLTSEACRPAARASLPATSAASSAHNKVCRPTETIELVTWLSKRRVNLHQSRLVQTKERRMAVRLPYHRPRRSVQASKDSGALWRIRTQACSPATTTSKQAGRVK